MHFLISYKEQWPPAKGLDFQLSVGISRITPLNSATRLTQNCSCASSPNLQAPLSHCIGTVPFERSWMNWTKSPIRHCWTFMTITCPWHEVTGQRSSHEGAPQGACSIMFSAILCGGRSEITWSACQKTVPRWTRTTGKLALFW